MQQNWQKIFRFLYSLRKLPIYQNILFYSMLLKTAENILTYSVICHQNFPEFKEAHDYDDENSFCMVNRLFQPFSKTANRLFLKSFRKRHPEFILINKKHQICFERILTIQIKQEKINYAKTIGR